MRVLVIFFALLTLSACSRYGPRTVVGTWKSEIGGAKFEVQIVKNWESGLGGYDLLTATVNGNKKYYMGSFDSTTFQGTGSDSIGSPPRAGRFILTEINKDGDLVCKLLNASQIPHGTVLKRVK